MFNYVLFMLIMQSATFLPLYSDDELLALVLAKFSRDGRYWVVNSKTDFYYFDEFLSWDHSGVLNGSDCQPLYRQLIEKNPESVELTIKTDLSKGYIIDKNGTFAKKYHSRNYDERWKFRRENPNIAGTTSVSLPVYDKQRNLVLIYRSCKYIVNQMKFR